MGFETANIHLASSCQKVKKHLKQQPENWLVKAAHAMAREVEADYHAFRKGSK
jgi:hypothetical protein